MVINKKDTLKNLLCSISKEKGSKLYFVSDAIRTHDVLKRYKIDFILMDTEITGLEGCQFITDVKKTFPNIEIIVTSKNLQERCDFLVSGADHFLFEPIVLQELLAILY